MRMEPLPVRDPVRISRTRRYTAHVVGAGLWLSGVAWLVLHYFRQQQTEFGPQANPFEHLSLATHGFFGFASLWTFGLLWAAHVVGAWKSKRHRLSGAVVFAVFAWLIGSGYLLYYLGSDELLPWVAIAHWGVGLALPLPYLAHRLAR